MQEKRLIDLRGFYKFQGHHSVYSKKLTVCVSHSDFSWGNIVFPQCRVLIKA